MCVCVERVCVCISVCVCVLMLEWGIFYVTFLKVGVYLPFLFIFFIYGGDL